MYVKINRNVCDHQLPICERCLGKFLAHPMGYERQCFEEIRDDGRDLLTLDIHTDTRDIRIELNDEQRKMMAGEGWATFLDFATSMYRTKTERPQ
jgi:hypothetical protein